jgi:hypothetical protein
MSESLEPQLPPDKSWKQRGKKEKPYRARRIAHDANTSIEYGEKTWTTAQTVRDLMQNHLDAETERYFRSIVSILFSEKAKKKYLDPGVDESEKAKAEKLLYAAFTFSKYVEGMTPETRLQSEEYLRSLADGLSVNSELQQEGTFSPQLFLDAVRPISEERPHVSYEIVDTETNASAGLVSYEALRDEPLYQQKNKDSFRYKIMGMKVTDHGSGFDSQLSALYISGKTGKRHLRGKFGEGAKMSELHILRHDATIKMRSQYTYQTNGAAEKNRIWQARPQVKNDKLVLHGVEVEQEGNIDTGSMITISLHGAEESFCDDFRRNVDPRLGGLADNVADFRSQGFVYPMPISEAHLAGVDISGKGDVQFVQGLRVELANDSLYGHKKPRFSYNFLDSSIIAGRDRNEITSGIVNKIIIFWCRTDNPDLLGRLAHALVHDASRDTNWTSPSPELEAFKGILGDESSTKTQKIADDALVHELTLEEQQDTLVTTLGNLRNPNYSDTISYAREHGYAIRTTAAVIGDFAISRCAARLLPRYKIITGADIDQKISLEKSKHDARIEKKAEGEKEKALRKVFSHAVDSVNQLVGKVGIEPKIFDLQFDTPPVAARRGRSQWNEDGGDSYFRADPHADLPPITFGLSRNETYVAIVNPDDISDPRYTDPRAVQRKLEIYLLNDFVFDHDEIVAEHSIESTEENNREDVLKQTQQFLDALITRLIPEGSPILEAIPQVLGYEKDPAVLMRLLKGIFSEEGARHKKEKVKYELYRRALHVDLAFEEVEEMHKNLLISRELSTVRTFLESRVFLSNDELTYYDNKRKEWVKQSLGDPTTQWCGRPIYALHDGRYFIHAPMKKGAVLARGEGKEREYTFSEGDNFLHIGQFDFGYGHYKGGYKEPLGVHPDGFILKKINPEDQEASPVVQQAQIQKELEGYSYYPTGTVQREGVIAKGVVSASIPIEYGHNEWSDPVRVFQDMVQNHIDASPEGELVQLTYEVDRAGNRAVVRAGELLPSDKITGLTMQDCGAGYYPNEIATMGASSKKSPLFAGKYGEGQKMVAAAALRNNLELTYQSSLQNGADIQSWSARTISKPRTVVLDGREAEKQFVAFDVTPTSDSLAIGSTTTLRLPLKASPAQEQQWAEWISIIDPRNKNENGHGGLARYVRQLRQPGSEHTCLAGSISVLLDEPGAVYENGLRINSQAEKGRDLAFGYDVPEIVTTRERNSFNAVRLHRYMTHAIAHITNPTIIETILQKVAYDKKKTPDLRIGEIMNYGSINAAPLWAPIAQKIWPGFVVYSSEDIEETMRNDLMSEGNERAIERARRIRANKVHLDRNKIIDVSAREYPGFSRILPTAESVIDRLETEVIPASPAVTKVLSHVVAESVKIFTDILQIARGTLTEKELERFPLRTYMLGNLEHWDNAATIEERGAVALAPISSAYHGKVDKGVILNEALLLKGKRRDLAETALHEMAHVASRESDYTEPFVMILYELAQHLAREK